MNNNNGVLECPVCGKPSIITIEPMGVWILVCETHNSWNIVNRNKVVGVPRAKDLTHKEFILAATETLINWLGQEYGDIVRWWSEHEDPGESHIPALEEAREAWGKNA